MPNLQKCKVGWIGGFLSENICSSSFSYGMKITSIIWVSKLHYHNLYMHNSLLVLSIDQEHWQVKSNLLAMKRQPTKVVHPMFLFVRLSLCILFIKCLFKFIFSIKFKYFYNKKVILLPKYIKLHYEGLRSEHIFN